MVSNANANGEAWAVRAARNQSLFRAVNEHVQDATAVAADDATVVIACECARVDCAEKLEISSSAYERLREHPNRFAVLPGHVYPDVEDVIEDASGFVVVAKRGEGADVASALHTATSE